MAFKKLVTQAEYAELHRNQYGICFKCDRILRRMVPLNAGPRPNSNNTGYVCPDCGTESVCGLERARNEKWLVVQGADQQPTSTT